jgi:hypothetical protein
MTPRSCVTYALPAFAVLGVTAAFDEADTSEVDFEPARLRTPRTGRVLHGTPWPSMLLEILTAGGTVAGLEAETLSLEETR